MNWVGGSRQRVRARQESSLTTMRCVFYKRQSIFIDDSHALVYFAHSRVCVYSTYIRLPTFHFTSHIDATFLSRRQLTLRTIANATLFMHHLVSKVVVYSILIKSSHQGTLLLMASSSNLRRLGEGGFRWTTLYAHDQLSPCHR